MRLGLSAESIGGQLGIQAVGVVATIVWSVVMTFVIVKITGALVGLRVSEDDELEGLDIATHGEKAYDL